jgi:hypothetical protein
MVKKRSIFALILLLIFSLAAVSSAMAASVTPVFIAGNPTCQDLGYAFSLKVDPPNSGTYSNLSGSVTFSTDGVYVDWSSTFGIDAVIVKGGPNANLYAYDPPAESFGDTGLSSPINPNNDKPFGLSHLEFCYDVELQAQKTANTAYTRTYTWTITKDVSPASHVGFNGDSFTSDYTVTLDQTVAESDFHVYGTISVYNPAPVSVSFSVSDVLDDSTGATVNCPSYTVDSGQTVECTYDAYPTGKAST